MHKDICQKDQGQTNHVLKLVSEDTNIVPETAPLPTSTPIPTSASHDHSAHSLSKSPSIV